MFEKYIDTFIKSLFSYGSNDNALSNTNIKNNNNQIGGVMSEDIIIKLAQNLNNLAILKIKSSNNMSGGHLFSAFPFLNRFPIGGPFFTPSPVGFPSGFPISPIIGPPFSSPFISPEPITIVNKPHYSSSFDGIKIADSIINIHNHLINNYSWDDIIGHLQVPILGIEYIGTVKLIRAYLIKAKIYSEEKRIDISTPYPTTITTNSAFITQIKAEAQKIINEKDTLGIHKFTTNNVNTLIGSIAHLRAVLNGAIDPTRYTSIINHCINTDAQLTVLNGLLIAAGVGAVPSATAVDAVIASPPANPVHAAVEGRLAAMLPRPLGPPHVINAANRALVLNDVAVATLQTNVDNAFLAIHTYTTNLFTEINRL